jgi:NDP-sugar pyrophosphorylase family protein
MQAIILAGGRGARLKPLTNILPKPLMPLGNISILEVVLKQLKYAGFLNVILAVGYMHHIIRSVFEDGSRFGLSIEYSLEEEPLGTAGPLSIIMDKLENNFLVMNGDVLTNRDFKAIFDFHVKKKSDATISIKQRKVNIDFGVIETDEKNNFKKYIEKPSYSFDVSMGINVFKRSAIEEILKYGMAMDIPNLIGSLKNQDKKILCYNEPCEWLDIGRLDDYETAIEIFEKDKNLYLK